jgi:hypothetical protein
MATMETRLSLDPDEPYQVAALYLPAFNNVTVFISDRLGEREVMIQMNADRARTFGDHILQMIHQAMTAPEAKPLASRVVKAGE